MSDPVDAVEPALLHDFKNHILLIVGYCDLLLRELPAGEIYDDIVEIQRAGLAATALLPQLAGAIRLKD